MILVIEKERLDFSEAQKQALLAMTAKDQIYLVTKKGDTIPVEIIPVINQISARLEIKQLSEGNSLFEKGFLYGTLSRSGGKEKVVILSEEKAPEGLDANCVWNEGFGAAKPKKKALPKKADDAKKETVMPAVAGKPRAKAVKDLFATPEFLAVADLVGDKREAFKNCLATASEGEIGYRMLLDVNFGREAGDKIWEKTKGRFDALRKLS